MAAAWHLNIFKSCEHAILLHLNFPEMALRELFCMLYSFFFLIVIKLWYFFFLSKTLRVFALSFFMVSLLHVYVLYFYYLVIETPLLKIALLKAVVWSLCV